MNALVESFRLVVFSNIWIALAATFFSFETAYLLNLELDIAFFSFVFSATLFSYSLQRLARHKEVSGQLSNRHKWFVDNRTFIWIITLLSGASGICFAFLSLSWNVLYFLIPLGLVSGLYSIKFLALTDNLKGLRDIAYIKVFLIAASWSVVAVPLTIFAAKENVRPDGVFWMLLIEKFLYILAITIPFDIRDLPYDSKYQKTIPQLFGVNKSITISVILTFICLILTYANPAYGYPAIIASTLAYLGTIVILISTNPERKELFYSGLIDGSIIIKVILVVCSVWLF